MAYNNYNNGTGQNGHRPGYQPGPRGGYLNTELPVEIQPKPVPENYVDTAEEVMRGLMSGRNNISTNKIRNLLSLVSDIYNDENLRTEDTMKPESVMKLMQMRVRTAYESGRDASTKNFVQKAQLMEYLKGIQNDRMMMIRFAHYMEALVAYHRYFGGKEG